MKHFIEFGSGVFCADISLKYFDVNDKYEFLVERVLNAFKEECNSELTEAEMPETLNEKIVCSSIITNFDFFVKNLLYYQDYQPRLLLDSFKEYIPAEHIGNLLDFYKKKSFSYSGFTDSSHNWCNSVFSEEITSMSYSFIQPIEEHTGNIRTVKIPFFVLSIISRLADKISRMKTFLSSNMLHFETVKDNIDDYIVYSAILIATIERYALEQKHLLAMIKEMYYDSSEPSHLLSGAAKFFD